MIGTRVSIRILPKVILMGSLVAPSLFAGCGERTAPLPAEAKTPGELKVPNLAQQTKPLAKNVNLKAPRSIKEVQPAP
jgi:hypothetical protein